MGDVHDNMLPEFEFDDEVRHVLCEFDIPLSADIVATEDIIAFRDDFPTPEESPLGERDLARRPGSAGSAGPVPPGFGMTEVGAKRRCVRTVRHSALLYARGPG